MNLTVDKPRYRQLGFRAAQKRRETGRPLAPGGSADAHARWDLDDLRRESQEFDRDNGLYRGLINRAIDNIVGEGVQFQARTKNAAVNRSIERLWAEFCRDPEVRGLFTWWQLERSVLRSTLVDGDIGGLLAREGKVQLFESEQIAAGSRMQAENGNRVERGVELDRLDRPVAFYLSAYSRHGGSTRRDYVRVPAENFVFLANLERASQTRGLPAQVSNFQMFDRINDVCNSEAISWQLLSRFAVAFELEEGPDAVVSRSSSDSNQETPPDLADRYHEVPEAVMFYGRPGEKITSIERNVPGQNFPNSVTMFLRLLGLPIGMPLELVLLDWSKTNYSSARAALEQAFRMFNCWQRLLINRWHRPIYLWKLRGWIEDGLVPERGDILKHEWNPHPFPWLDQLKEAQAWGERVDRGFSTHSEALHSRNLERDDVNDARELEIRDAIKRADAINKEFPAAEVPWEIFAGMKPLMRSADMQGGPNESAG